MKRTYAKARENFWYTERRPGVHLWELYVRRIHCKRKGSRNCTHRLDVFADSAHTTSCPPRGRRREWVWVWFDGKVCHPSTHARGTAAWDYRGMSALAGSLQIPALPNKPSAAHCHTHHMHDYRIPISYSAVLSITARRIQNQQAPKCSIAQQRTHHCDHM